MELTEDLVACGAIRFGKFTLTSGRTSHYYVDVKAATSRPDVLRSISDAMSVRVGDADVLAGVELGAVPLLVAVSLQTDKPYAIVRKGDRGHGTGRQIEGAPVHERRVVILEDVTTTGGSVAAAVKALRDAGANVDRVETVVDRGEGATQALAKLGVRLSALVDAPTLLRKSEEATA